MPTVGLHLRQTVLLVQHLPVIKLSPLLALGQLPLALPQYWSPCLVVVEVVVLALPTMVAPALAQEVVAEALANTLVSRPLSLQVQPIP
jgi:hypothetical protein